MATSVDHEDYSEQEYSNMPVIKSSMAPVQQGDAGSVPTLPGRITHAPDCPHLNCPDEAHDHREAACPICGCMTEQQLRDFLTQCRNARLMGPANAPRAKRTSAMPTVSGPASISEDELG